MPQYRLHKIVMEKIKIILVDDHRIVRDGLKSLLADCNSVEIAGEAENAYDFLKILNHTIPDVVLLDIALPKMSGIELAKIIKTDFPGIKILMLSMYTSEDFIFNSLKAGVLGYLPKNTTKKELTEAIKTVFSGKEYFSKSISDTILKSYMNSAKFGKEIKSDKIKTLTKRENELLFYVVEGLSNSQISEKLSISVRTVETHKTNILKKLGLNNVVDLVKYAIRNNIIEL